MVIAVVVVEEGRGIQPLTDESQSDKRDGESESAR
jgi:hypothetical protein